MIRTKRNTNRQSKPNLLNSLIGFGIKKATEYVVDNYLTFDEQVTNRVVIRPFDCIEWKNDKYYFLDELYMKEE